MTELIQKKLSDSTGARWTALLIVAFTMMMGYFITDVMSPLEVLLETPKAQGGLGWTAGDYGIFAGSYGFINVFLLMLFFGGIILDKMGIRFTGIMACSLMVIGVLIKYVGVSVDFGDSQFTLGTFSLPMSAAVACLGFAIFGVGCEICGITVSKVITKWFTGHELALAMGVQVGLARMGTFAAMSFSLPVARAFGNRVSAPVLLGAVLLIVGLLAFIVYTVMDRKLDASAAAIDTETQHSADDEGFHFADLKFIFTNPGFWCIALLCLMFYGGVFPFLKFATKLMVANYHVPAQFAGTLPGLLPLGTIALTPIFGIIYDKIGKGVTLMLIGSTMLALVHLVCRGDDDSPWHSLFAGALGYVAQCAQNHSAETLRFGLCHHLLHSKHRLEPFPRSHWQAQ